MRRVEDDEYFFITYDNVIRNPYAYILHQLVNNDEYKDYKDFLDNELIGKSIDELCELLTVRPVKNPLEYFATKEFDYDLSLIELYLIMLLFKSPFKSTWLCTLNCNMFKYA